MTEAAVHRFALVECRVLTHQAYGLVIEILGGRNGFVDKADIVDGAVLPKDWPRVGEVVTCVVLGEARDGRIRASARPSDIALARSVNDPGGLLVAWIRIRDTGFTNARERADFFASRDGISVMRWALHRHVGSVDRARVSEILSDAPKDVLDEVYG